MILWVVRPPTENYQFRNKTLNTESVGIQRKTSETEVYVNFAIRDQ